MFTPAELENWLLKRGHIYILIGNFSFVVDGKFGRQRVLFIGLMFKGERAVRRSVKSVKIRAECEGCVFVLLAVVLGEILGSGCCASGSKLLREPCVLDCNMDAVSNQIYGILLYGERRTEAL